jgi:hypothetical protein
VTARVQRGEVTIGPRLQNLPGSAPVQVDKLPVGTFMRASLGGSSFTTERVGQELQPLLDGETAEWTWSVNPKSEGERTLLLSISVELDGEPLSSRIFERTIVVDVEPLPSPKSWLRSNFSEVILLVIGAIVGAMLTLGGDLARRRWFPAPQPAPGPPATTGPMPAPANPSAAAKRPIKKAGRTSVKPRGSSNHRT